MTPEQQLQQAILNCYNNNMKYLKMYHKDIYNNIQALNEAIDSGFYETKYELELKENSYFDIFDKVNNNFIYNTNSIEFSQKLLNNFKFDESGLNTIHNLFFDNLNLRGAKKHFSLSDYLISPVLNQYSKILKPKKKKDIKFKRINKMIFNGTLLGIHLPIFHKKLKSSVYFIVENNLEIFRLSLFTTDYASISSESTLLFSVMDEDFIFQRKVKDFATLQLGLNYNIKYLNISKQYDTKLQTIVDIIYQNSSLNFHYKLQLRNLRQAAVNLNNKFNFLHPRKDINNKNNPFTQYPVLILGPGPSLSKNIEWIKKNKNNFIIISLGGALKKLVSNGIRPDIITTADGEHTFFEQFNIEDKSIFNDIILFASLYSPKNIMKLFKPDNSFFFENINILPKNDFSIDCLTIGEASYALALILNSKNIYMLGLDLAIDNDTGNTHDTSYKSSSIDLNNFDKDFYKKNNSVKPNNLILKKGNFRDEILTTRHFYSSLYFYKANSKEYQNSDQTVFNLSDGLFIDNTVPAHIKDIKTTETINKDKIYPDLIKYLKENSFSSLSNDEKKYFITLLNKLNLCDSFLSNLKNKEIHSFKELIEIKNNILSFFVKELSNYKFAYLPFFNFEGIIGNYLNFFYFQKNIELNKEEVQSLYNRMIRDLHSILHKITISSELISKKKPDLKTRLS